MAERGRAGKALRKMRSSRRPPSSAPAVYGIALIGMIIVYCNINWYEDRSSNLKFGPSPLQFSRY